MAESIRVTLSRRFAGGPMMWATGAAFLGDELLSSEALATYLQQSRSTQEVVARAKRLNGFFAAVIQASGRWYLVTDGIRSTPLFYGQLPNQEWWVSDEIPTATTKTLDKDAVADFLQAGYVTGPHTLFSGIHQVQAGEVVALPSSDTEHPRAQRYFLFRPANPGTIDYSAANIGTTLRAAIKRLIAYANGRKIVIPLSGGLDSRLIALHLVSAGYSNICAFTYGRENNAESKISKEVADTLGIPWSFVTYTSQLWDTLNDDPEWIRYLEFAERGSSVPHIQDWLAIRELRRKGVIPEDSVFVPGHAGDFVAGSHIPRELLSRRIFTSEDVARTVYNRHMTLVRIEDLPRVAGELAHIDMLRRLRRIEEILGPSAALSLADAVGVYEEWDWQERQSKFITNSVRVYEFFGYDWWLPLWDSEFATVWLTAPLDARLQKRDYIQYVKEFERSVAGTTFASDAERHQTLRRLFEALGVKSIVSRVVSKLKPSLPHPLAWDDFLHKPESGMEAKLAHVNGRLAAQRIYRHVELASFATSPPS